MVSELALDKKLARLAGLASRSSLRGQSASGGDHHRATVAWPVAYLFRY